MSEKRNLHLSRPTGPSHWPRPTRPIQLGVVSGEWWVWVNTNPAHKKSKTSVLTCQIWLSLAFTWLFVRTVKGQRRDFFVEKSTCLLHYCFAVNKMDIETPFWKFCKRFAAGTVVIPQCQWNPTCCYLPKITVQHTAKFRSLRLYFFLSFRQATCIAHAACILVIKANWDEISIKRHEFSFNYT